jgi:MMP 1-O-methyltransferase
MMLAISDPICVHIEPGARVVLSRDTRLQRYKDGWRLRLRPPYTTDLEVGTYELKRLLALARTDTDLRQDAHSGSQFSAGDLIARAIYCGFLISTRYEVRGKAVELSLEEIDSLRGAIKPGHLAMLEIESLLLYLLARENPFPEPICELGTLYGGSTIALALGARLCPQANRVITVDDHEWQKHLPEGWLQAEDGHQVRGTLDIFRQNLIDAGLFDSVDMYVEDTAGAGRRHQGYISMLLVDAGHRRQDIESDIQAWLPKLVSGGAVVFHDYGGAIWPDVQAVVDELRHLFSSFCCHGELAVATKR